MVVLSPSVWSRVRPYRRWIAALLFVSSLSTLWAAYLAHSSATDLRVYFDGVSAFLNGHDPYAMRFGNPPKYAFTYPPFSFLAFSPFVVIGFLATRIGMALLSIAALLFIVDRILAVANISQVVDRIGRYPLVLAASAAALWLEPVRHTLFLGQINLILLALIAHDIFNRKRRLPTGVLIGIATAIKLTPGIFILYFVFIRRWRAAVTAVISAIGATAISFVIAPQSSWDYWTQLVFDIRRTGRTTYVANQSLRGFIGRAYYTMNPPQIVLLLATLLAISVAFIVVRQFHQQGNHLMSAGAIGILGLLISPISWNHHWVWILPVAAGIVVEVYRRRNKFLWLFALLWISIFYAGPMWWVSHDNNELRYSPSGIFDVFLANSYIIAAIVLMLTVFANALINWLNTRKAPSPVVDSIDNSIIRQPFTAKSKIAPPCDMPSL